MDFGNKQWRSQTRAHPDLGPGVSVQKTVELCSTAICNDSFSYALLTSLFARLAFNTREDLCCAHVCRSHGSELLPIEDRRHFKNSLKNNLNIATSKMQKIYWGSMRPPPPTKKNKNQKTSARASSVT